ncbi:hypothetical protein K437DRAFT_70381 [Tilletiaria anomala UBC 951]|uniref:Uncharacterized protein n=1 Tax=Tilletiaria anomala (strain ATCC 24038 / CBS 436.72 / UBC 951) TaxID=1037660 RepID=A0A066WRX3_TILAU|nr:uncharacterized protein K437DRAFT_70381 [Tilletiaria anomala UBC 951]KDN53405.1 hypothetical protein K437DRAFT_70381 [Tilletiaria anomala UBC 951]
MKVSTAFVALAVGAASPLFVSASPVPAGDQSPSLAGSPVGFGSVPDTGVFPSTGGVHPDDLVDQAEAHKPSVNAPTASKASKAARGLLSVNGSSSGKNPNAGLGLLGLGSASNVVSGAGISEGTVGGAEKNLGGLINLSHVNGVASGKVPTSKAPSLLDVDGPKNGQDAHTLQATLNLCSLLGINCPTHVPIRVKGTSGGKHHGDNKKYSGSGKKSGGSGKHSAGSGKHSTGSGKKSSGGKKTNNKSASGKTQINNHVGQHGGSAVAGNGGTANGGKADCSVSGGLIGLSALNFNSCNGGLGGSALGGNAIGGAGGETISKLLGRDATDVLSNVVNSQHIPVNARAIPAGIPAGVPAGVASGVPASIPAGVPATGVPSTSAPQQAHTQAPLSERANEFDAAIDTSAINAPALNSRSLALGGSAISGNGGSAKGGASDSSISNALIGIDALNFGSNNGGAGGLANAGKAIGGKGGKKITIHHNSRDVAADAAADAAQVEQIVNTRDFQLDDNADGLSSSYDARAVNIQTNAEGTEYHFDARDDNFEVNVDVPQQSSQRRALPVDPAAGASPVLAQFNNAAKPYVQVGHRDLTLGAEFGDSSSAPTARDIAYSVAKSGDGYAASETDGTRDTSATIARRHDTTVHEAVTGTDVDINNVEKRTWQNQQDNHGKASHGRVTIANGGNGGNAKSGNGGQANGNASNKGHTGSGAGRGKQAYHSNTHGRFQTITTDNGLITINMEDLEAFLGEQLLGYLATHSQKSGKHYFVASNLRQSNQNSGNGGSANSGPARGGDGGNVNISEH